MSQNPGVSITGLRVDLTINQAESLVGALGYVLENSKDFTYSIAKPLRKKLLLALKGNIGYAPVEET